MGKTNFDEVQLDDSGLYDGNGVKILAAQQSTIADAAVTAVAVDLTFTANGPTAADTQTIADGAAPTGAETGQFMANVEDFMAEVATDLADVNTQLNAVIAALKAHGLIASS